MFLSLIVIFVKVEKMRIFWLFCWGNFFFFLIWVKEIRVGFVSGEIENNVECRV